MGHVLGHSAIGATLALACATAEAQLGPPADPSEARLAEAADGTYSFSCKAGKTTVKWSLKGMFQDVTDISIVSEMGGRTVDIGAGAKKTLSAFRTIRQVNGFCGETRSSSPEPGRPGLTDNDYALVVLMDSTDQAAIWFDATGVVSQYVQKIPARTNAPSGFREVRPSPPPKPG